MSPTKQIARLLGLPPGQDRLVGDIIMCREFAGPREACAALGEIVSLDPQHKEALLRLWTDQEMAAVEIPGAAGAVLRARELGFAVGLVSDIWVPYYRAFLRACPGIASLVDYAALSFRLGRKKPAEELYRAALEALDADPRRSVMIGDTYEKDILPAINMGLAAIWVLSRPEREYPAMARVLWGEWPRPDIIVRDTSQLARALEELEQKRRDTCSWK
ncbi:FMN phosphatase YigB (HAD superfamily) [Desulfofundulus luciae]|uniref:FMN phosphatase YigB (HAD superfamily) n=1 Tax=Desulfofundulus luciae TaxID=74702 RepID=A0ABU0AYB5_9FIRM|nr:HAD family hydrolase [Desulfofundulus luciae]MDQ0285037.1 FMN phosphatase YigB (HAD superfamily) [Desulfofundulus luciae]